MQSRGWWVGAALLMIVAQAEAQTSAVTPPASVLMRSEAFARWNAPTNDSVRAEATSQRLSSGSGKWWGLGIGAGIGSVGGIVAVNALCNDDDGCSELNLGAAIIGALIFGTIGLFVGDAID